MPSSWHKTESSAIFVAQNRIQCHVRGTKQDPVPSSWHKTESSAIFVIPGVAHPLNFKVPSPGVSRMSSFSLPLGVPCEYLSGDTGWGFS